MYYRTRDLWQMINPPRSRNLPRSQAKILYHGDTKLATIDSVMNTQHGLSFLGDREDFLQIGKFRYDSGHIMRDHAHIDRERISRRTQEILIVFKGSCQVRIFDLDDKVAHVDTLVAGDYIVYYHGGIGFTVLEKDTIMMEIKNGPYDVQLDDEDRRLI